MLLFLVLECLQNRVKKTFFANFSPAAGVPPAESSASGVRRDCVALGPSGLDPLGPPPSIKSWLRPWVMNQYEVYWFRLSIYIT